MMDIVRVFAGGGGMALANFAVAVAADGAA